MMNTRLVKSVSMAELQAMDAALTDKGRMRLLPAAELRRFRHDALCIWMQYSGRYQLPTLELVQWLRERIAGRTCVEIGAGRGDVGRHVGGVALTDSYFQDTPEMQAFYALSGCMPTIPPPDVWKYEGVRAVRQYRPQVVLACWVTQLYQPGDEVNRVGSCVGGVDEMELLRHAPEYIFVGNAGTHRDKRILKLKHEEFSPDWIVSRAADQSLNRIWVWTQ
jgi:hypothetical protein